VGVSDAGPFSYQWLLNGTNVANNFITTYAGKYPATPPLYSGDNGAATNAKLNSPCGMAVDSSGNVFIADTFNNRVRKVDTNGIITTVAGTNYVSLHYSGDGAPATNANLWGPSGVAVDNSGNIFIADAENARIRKVNTNGIISTFAGNGTNGFYGDGGQATNAEIHIEFDSDPTGLCFDTLGNLYFTDTGNGAIRKIDTNGIITTIASSGFPINVAVDQIGNVFFTDIFGGGLVRKLDTNGVVTTVAGGGSSIVGGGFATNAQISPFGLCVDTDGNLFIGDVTNTRRGVDKVDTNGILTTVAGNGTLGYSGYSGDGGLATNANLGCVYGLGFDPHGNLLVLDQLVGVVRKVWFAGWPVLPLNNLYPTTAGNYQVIVSGSGGSVTSSVANLSVFYPPVTSSVVTNNGSRFVISWPVFKPSVFQVQWTTNLIDGTWSNLGGTVSYSKTTSGTIGQSDSLWTNYVQGFYRLVWLQ